MLTSVFPPNLWNNKKTGSEELPMLLDDYEAEQEAEQAKAEAMDSVSLEAIARAHSTDKPETRVVIAHVTVRDRCIAENAKRIANGICQLCGNPAPFIKDGKPYLESHHIVWLSEGGADSIDNTVALCPNCHRKMHIVKSPADVAALKAKKSSK